MADIELKKIQPNRLNPRLEFTKAGLDELSDSIKQVGLLEPIIVRPYGGDYQTDSVAISTCSSVHMIEQNEFCRK